MLITDRGGLLVLAADSVVPRLAGAATSIIFVATSTPKSKVSLSFIATKLCLS